MELDAAVEWFLLLICDPLSQTQTQMPRPVSTQSMRDSESRNALTSGSKERARGAITGKGSGSLAQARGISKG